MSLNKYSKVVTQDPTQPAAKAMLHAIGLSIDDLCKPFVGIASTGYEGNPCNMHLNDLSKNIKDGINKNELIGLIFNIIPYQISLASVKIFKDRQFYSSAKLIFSFLIFPIFYMIEICIICIYVIEIDAI